MAKGLTVKETKLVKARAEGKTISDAAKIAEYLPNATDETRRVEASRTLQKPHVQEALQVALEKHGITLDRAIEPISKALVATKVEIKGNDTDGHFAEVVEDLDMQLKGSDRALKLMNIGQGAGTTIIFNQGDVVRSKYVQD